MNSKNAKLTPVVRNDLPPFLKMSKSPYYESGDWMVLFQTIVMLT